MLACAICRAATADGDRECEGNRFQLCARKLYPAPLQWFNFVTCQSECGAWSEGTQQWRRRWLTGGLARAPVRACFHSKNIAAGARQRARLRRPARPGLRATEGVRAERGRPRAAARVGRAEHVPAHPVRACLPALVPTGEFESHSEQGSLGIVCMLRQALVLHCGEREAGLHPRRVVVLVPGRPLCRRLCAADLRRVCRRRPTGRLPDGPVGAWSAA